jgi:flagellin
MIINHNISALNTYRQLSINVTAGNRSLEKLSSGYRINRAGDDAAGLAISEKMRGQIRGLNMASKNAQDGISLIQTAEGALNETHSILQRMRELAVQAANGTNTDADRAELQKEIEQLKSEINRISTDIEFNTLKLLDGSVAYTADVDTTNDARLGEVEVINDNISAGVYKVNIAVQTINKTVDAGGTNITAVDIADPETVEMGKYTVEVSNGANQNTFALTLKNEDDEDIATTDNVANDATSVDLDDFTLTIDTGLATGTAEFTISAADFTATVYDADGNVIESKTFTGNSAGYVKVGGFKINIDSNLTNGDTYVTVDTKAVAFQIGANQNQITKLSISNMSSYALNVDGLDVSTAESASQAIGIVDEAILKVSSERAKLGAIQNRLEHTINNLGTSAENLTAAESRIRDVDMAKEMMEFYKNSILQQAAQAMLAQANQLPQGVLQLLR